MKNLLKADFRRIFKGKGIYVILIISFAFPAISALVLRFSGALDLIEEAGQLPPGFFDPINLYGASFSPTQNIGLILLIFTTILISSEFTNNTIRHKIIAGHSKSIIFLSSLITLLTYVFIVVLVNTSATYLFNTLLLGKKPFIDYFKRGLVGYTGIFALYTLLTLLTYHFKNLAGPLGIVLGFYFVLMMITTIIFNAKAGDTSSVNVLYYIFPVLYLSGLVVPVNNEWLISTLVNTGYIVIFSVLGLLVANRTDYK